MHKTCSIWINVTLLTVCISFFAMPCVGDDEKSGVRLSTSQELDWVKVTDDAGWSPRDSCGEYVFKNQLWILGGWVALEGPGPRDVWTSADGKNWTQVCEQAPWTHADLSVSLVYKDKMWLMAGWCGGRSKDSSASNRVWSSADGKNWDRVCDPAPWKTRLGAAGAVFKGKMWILGGNEQYHKGAKFLLNDVWCTEDGKNWTKITEHAPWPARAYHAAVVFDDKLWIIGGGNYRPDPLSFNDVWYSKDGVNWTQATDKSPWHARIWFSSVVYRNRIWVIGGWSDEPSTNYNDIWYSADGKDWREFKTKTIWKARHETSAWVWREQIWLAAGNPWPVVNDVWRLHLPPAAKILSTTKPATQGK